MHRASFWLLVDVLTDAGGDGYWGMTPGHPSRSAYQQIAIALYMLGGGAGIGERSRSQMNIRYGTLWAYMWRTVQLLSQLAASPRVYSMASPYSQWGPWIFQWCTGFLDGSIIVLRYKPMVDHAAYFSRKHGWVLHCEADIEDEHLEVDERLEVDELSSLMIELLTNACPVVQNWNGPKMDAIVYLP